MKVGSSFNGVWSETNMFDNLINSLGAMCMYHALNSTNIPLSFY